MNYTLVLLYSGILHKIISVYSMSKTFTYMFINFSPLAFELLKHFETLGLGFFCPAPSTKSPILVIQCRSGI